MSQQQQAGDGLEPAAGELSANLRRQLAERGAWRLRRPREGQQQGGALDFLAGPRPTEDAGLLAALAAAAAAAGNLAPFQGRPTGQRHQRVDAESIEALPPAFGPAGEGLVASGMLSALAFGFIDAALTAGRNVLVAGPYSAAWPPMALWLARGREPGVLAPTAVADEGWREVRDVGHAHRAGIDRLGAWGLSPRRLTRTMAEGNAIIGYLAAYGLEQALMRFERASGGGGGPLSVLSALDLVVVVELTASQRGQVSAIYGIEMADEAYRPRPLFVRQTGAEGHAPLLPVGQMPLSEPLGRLGLGHLAEDWQKAAGQNEAGSLLGRPVGGAPAAAPPLREAGHAERGPSPLARGDASDGLARARPSARPALARERQVQHALQRHGVYEARPGRLTGLGHRPVPNVGMDLSPGWELDQSAEEEPAEPLVEPGSEATRVDRGPVEGGAERDAASLAATYGLGPPEAPTTVTPLRIPTSLGEEMALHAPTKKTDTDFLAALAASSRPIGFGDEDTASFLQPRTLEAEPTLHEPRPAEGTSTEADGEDTAAATPRPSSRHD